jgi:hypothetical protein
MKAKIPDTRTGLLQNKTVQSEFEKGDMNY